MTRDGITKFESITEHEAESRLKKLFRKFNREVETELQKDRRKLFKALEEFANILPNKEAWIHFRKRWPRFFPVAEYEKVENGKLDSIANYPELLREVWDGSPSFLLPLLGVDAESPFNDEQATAKVHRIPAQFFADWDEGVFRYRGMCDFQRALYLLFRESWRARTCEKCRSKFIAMRVAQKYCSTDCSESVQRELKLTWWKQHGERWRAARKSLKSMKGRKHGTRKTQ